MFEKKKEYWICLIAILCMSLGVLGGCGKANEESTATYKMPEIISVTPADGSDVKNDTLSEEDYQTYCRSVDNILDSVSKYSNRGFQNDGDVEAAIDKVYELAEDMKKEGAVKTATKHDTYVFIEFKSGIQYLYLPEIVGINAGGSNGSVSIWSVQEGKSTYIGDDKAVAADEKATDGAAKKIADTFDNYKWDVNIDDEAVTLQTAMDFSSNEVILWNGHGDWCEEYGSFICTRERFDDHIYGDRKLWITAGDKEYIVTSYAIDTYVKDLSNSFLMFGTCNGLRSDNLSKSFANKNAKALVLNTDITTSEYAGNIMASIIEHMVQGNTLDEAMQQARSEYGEHDPNLWTQFGALDYSVPTICFGGDYKFGTESVDLLTYYLKTYDNRGDFIAPDNAEVLIDTFDSTAYAVNGSDCFTYYREDNGYIIYHNPIEGVSIEGIYPGMARENVKPMLAEKGYSFSGDGSASLEGAVSYSFGENGQVTGNATSDGSTSSTERYTKDTGGGNGEYVYLSIKYTGDQVQSIEAGIMYPNAG
ncbi:MAG: hypothetical protein IJK17_03075 [Lachnospiraceae bacterium]|nr:hypothetical protein [Lachnospiraceae bacterium]